MSMFVGIFITVHDVRDDDENSAVEEIVQSTWGSDDPHWDEDQKTFSTYAESNIAGGNSEGSLLEKISRAVWENLGRFVPVDIEVAYLEQTPHEDFHADEEDYEAWKKKEEKEKP